MVARLVAGLGITREALVKRLAFRLYLILALISLIMAGVWQGMRFPVTTPQSFAIHFYQHGLGHLDGRSCPSYPVCSAYARQALQQHGWIIGSWLAMDRLIHENDDLSHSQGHEIVFEGEKRLYDPLSRNDFWLK